jgi:hypothetical protein
MVECLRRILGLDCAHRVAIGFQNRRQLDGLVGPIHTVSPTADAT